MRFCVLRCVACCRNCCRVQSCPVLSFPDSSGPVQRSTSPHILLPLAPLSQLNPPPSSRSLSLPSPYLTRISFPRRPLSSFLLPHSSSLSLSLSPLRDAGTPFPPRSASGFSSLPRTLLIRSISSFALAHPPFALSQLQPALPPTSLAASSSEQASNTPRQQRTRKRTRIRTH